MNARELEDQFLSRCATAATQPNAVAHNQREANIFRTAALLIQSRHPEASSRLMRASAVYFSQHANEQLSASDVMKKGWLISLPRARDLLCRKLN
jgi:hypothetical protein